MKKAKADAIAATTAREMADLMDPSMDAPLIKWSCRTTPKASPFATRVATALEAHVD